MVVEMKGETEKEMCMLQFMSSYKSIYRHVQLVHLLISHPR